MNNFIKEGRTHCSEANMTADEGGNASAEIMMLLKTTANLLLKA